MAKLETGLTQRTMRAIWRDRAHAALLERMQTVSKLKDINLFSEKFPKECLGNCVTRDHLHKVFTGRGRFSALNYEVLHKRLSVTELELGLKPGLLIEWWKLEN